MGDPRVIYAQMMKTNPRFRQFVADNRGKSLDEVCAAYGVDPAVVRDLLR